MSRAGVVLRTAVAAWLAVAAPGVAAQCMQGAISAGPSGLGSRIEICSEITRQVPELQAAVDKLTRAQNVTNDRLQAIERLFANLNAAASRIDQKSVTLARSVATRLTQDAARPDAATTREIRRLSDNIEEVLERLDSATSNQQNAQAARALKAPIGDALATLDLDLANRLIGGIDALQRQLGSVETKVDAIRESVDEGRQLAALAEATKIKSRGDLGQVAALAALVRAGKTFEGNDFSGVGFSGLRAAGIKAAGSDLSLSRLTDAQLANSDLSGARLIAAHLNGSDFQGANLQNARAALALAQKTSFKGASLQRSSWIGADLRGADLQGADLRGASFEHADLNGADLRNARLEGAFFGNADLRGAQLAGASFGNTDVTSALLRSDAVTATQFASLCSTPVERDQSWTVVEKIPSGRFSGGYEYRRIFEERVFVGAGGDRPYPRCATRSEQDLPRWNPPVFHAGGRDRWSDNFGFQVEHALVNGAGRRGELLDRADAAFKAAQERKRHLQSMPQFAGLLRALNAKVEQRLRTLLANPAPRAPLFFDADTGMLLALRLNPDILPALEFDWKEASQGGFSDVLGHRGDKTTRPWPRLFPEDVMTSDLNEGTTSAFERWTRARSRALARNEVQVNLATGLGSRASAWHKVIVHNSQFGNADQRLAAALSVDVDRVVAFTDCYSSVWGARKRSCTVFVVEPSVAEYQKSLLGPNGSQVSATAVVTQVRLLQDTSQPRGYDHVVWYLRMSPQ